MDRIKSKTHNKWVTVHILLEWVVQTLSVNWTDSNWPKLINSLKGSKSEQNFNNFFFPYATWDYLYINSSTQESMIITVHNIIRDGLNTNNTYNSRIHTPSGEIMRHTITNKTLVTNN